MLWSARCCTTQSIAATTWDTSTAPSYTPTLTLTSVASGATPRKPLPLVLSLPVSDVSNSLRVYRADKVRDIPLTCNHFDVIEEILVKMRRRHPGLRIAEVPVNFRRRMFGETKRNLVTFALGFAVTLVRLRFAYRDQPRLPPPTP